MATPKIRTLDLRLLDDVFAMGGGYVLDFTNATFADFFLDELGVDIDAPRYSAEGGSKAKRLRYFLRKAPPKLAAKATASLWEYRETLRRRAAQDESLPHAKGEIAALVTRLSDGEVSTGEPDVSPPSEQVPGAAVLTQLRQELIELSSFEPQPRGYAFEKFLKALFDAYGLGGRASFRLTGEQIDGSFELGNETYLLEAKWTNAQIDAAELRAFNAKVEDKAAWSRGLFVSQNGFTDTGLRAFGRGNSIVCMDGLDLYEMLNGSIGFPQVVARKVRRVAETGQAFVRVRDLFPEKV